MNTLFPKRLITLLLLPFALLLCQASGNEEGLASKANVSANDFDLANNLSLSGAYFASHSNEIAQAAKEVIEAYRTGIYDLYMSGRLIRTGASNKDIEKLNESLILTQNEISQTALLQHLLHPIDVPDLLVAEYRRDKERRYNMFCDVGTEGVASPSGVRIKLVRDKKMSFFILLFNSPERLGEIQGAFDKFDDWSSKAKKESVKDFRKTLHSITCGSAFGISGIDARATVRGYSSCLGNERMAKLAHGGAQLINMEMIFEVNSSGTPALKMKFDDLDEFEVDDIDRAALSVMFSKAPSILLELSNQKAEREKKKQQAKENEEQEKRRKESLFQ